MEENLGDFEYGNDFIDTMKIIICKEISWISLKLKTSVQRKTPKQTEGEGTD